MCVKTAVIPKQPPLMIFSVHNYLLIFYLIQVINNVKLSK